MNIRLNLFLNDLAAGFSNTRKHGFINPKKGTSNQKNKKPHLVRKRYRTRHRLATYEPQRKIKTTGYNTLK
jgi:hypothetical protein